MARVENYDNWSEDAQWAVIHLFGFVPREIWQKGPPDIDITIEGVTAENLQQFFEDLMLAFRAEVKKKVVKGILSKFDESSEIWDALFESARGQLKNTLAKKFDVTWDYCGEPLVDWTADRRPIPGSTE